MTADNNRSVLSYQWTDDPRWLLYIQDDNGDPRQLRQSSAGRFGLARAGPQFRYRGGSARGVQPSGKSAFHVANQEGRVDSGHLSCLEPIAVIPAAFDPRQLSRQARRQTP